MRAILVATAIAVGAAATPAQASDEWTEAGIGVGTVLANVIYMPAKVTYAVLGSTVAGLAWIVSAGDQDVFSPILNTSLRGDYVLTPSHLKGDRQIVFVGRKPRPSVASAPEPVEEAWTDTTWSQPESEWSADPAYSSDEGF